jgi:tetratricopeptide (TPR) repeat protein
MKKIVLAMLLVASITAVAQTSPAPVPQGTAPVPQGAAPTPQGTAPVPQGTAPVPQGTAPVPQGSATTPAQNAAPQKKKEIKDPAEYNAYVGAAGQTDPNAQISGFEAFVTQYPNSNFKEEALEQLMVDYQKVGNQAKMIDTAQKTLQVNPCNIRALALVTYSKQSAATGPSAQQSLNEAGQTAEKGMECWQTAQRPDGMSAPDWDQLHKTTMGIFDNAAAMAAYAAKDFPKAERYLKEGIAGDPNNLTEVYYMGLADLSPGAGENDPEGLFWIARAAALQTGPGKQKIADFGRVKYKNYHGSEDGWNDLLTQAQTLTAPPADIATKVTKYVPPTPAQQAADIVKSKKVEEMSFAEWQLVLSEGTPEDAEKVWSTLKGKPLQMVASVIAIDPAEKITEKGKPVDAPTKLHLAGSSDDIDAKRADIDLTMTAAIPKKDMPAVAADFQFQGTPVSYVAKPFVMTMDDGALLVKAAPKAPVRRKPSAQ